MSNASRTADRFSTATPFRVRLDDGDASYATVGCHDKCDVHGSGDVAPSRRSRILGTDISNPVQLAGRNRCRFDRSGFRRDVFAHVDGIGWLFLDLRGGLHNPVG